MEIKQEMDSLVTQVSSNNKIWKIITIIALALLLTIGIYSITQEVKVNKLENQITNQSYSQFQPFIEKRAKDSSTIVEQTQLLANKDAQIVKQIEKIEHLKTLSSQVVYKTEVQIKEIKVPFIDSSKVITIVDSTSKDSTDYLALPARAQLITPNLQIEETVLKTGLELNYAIIPDSTTLTIGDKGNLFKNEPSVLIKHSNPFIKTLDVKNIVVKDNKKPWKTFAIGTSVGATAVSVGFALLKAFVFH